MADLSVDLIAIAKRIKLIMEMEKKLETRMRNLEARLNSQVDPGLPCGGMSNQLQFSHCYPVSVTSISSNHFWGAILAPTGSLGATDAFTNDPDLGEIRIEKAGGCPAVGNKVLATFVGVAGATFEAFYGTFQSPIWHFGTLATTLTSGGVSGVTVTANSTTTVYTAYAPTYIGTIKIPANAVVEVAFNQDDSKWYVMGGPCQ